MLYVWDFVAKLLAYKLAFQGRTFLCSLSKAIADGWINALGPLVQAIGEYRPRLFPRDMRDASGTRVRRLSASDAWDLQYSLFGSRTKVADIRCEHWSSRAVCEANLVFARKRDECLAIAKTAWYEAYAPQIVSFARSSRFPVALESIPDDGSPRTRTKLTPFLRGALTTYEMTEREKELEIALAAAKEGRTHIFQFEDRFEKVPADMRWTPFEQSRLQIGGLLDTSGTIPRPTSADMGMAYVRAFERFQYRRNPNSTMGPGDMVYRGVDSGKIRHVQP